MVNAVLALPRMVVGTAFRTARAALEALEALPRIAGAIEDLRDATRHVERLATFASGELPEVVYQLESVREQLATLEKRLTGKEEEVTRASSRSG